MKGAEDIYVIINKYFRDFCVSGRILSAGEKAVKEVPVINCPCWAHQLGEMTYSLNGR